MSGATPEAAAHPAASLLSLGLTQEAVSPDLGARLFAEDPDPAAFQMRLREARLSDVLALATCERIEVFAASPGPDTAGAILGALAAATGVEAAALSDQARQRHGEAALARLFAVAASMDSQVLGEPLILGQVRECHRAAAALGLVGPGLEACLEAAYAAAKRVRSETEIGRYPVSIAAAALLVARDVHGELKRCKALLIGLGEMGEFMGGELKAAGLRDMVVVHPSAARARAAAQRLACHHRPWDELEEALAGADIVVGALGTGGFSVTAPQAERALRARRREPIYFIDAAVPQDFEPSVNELDGAFVYDLEDLERIALSGLASRERALEAAQAILAEELEAFLRRHAARGAVPSLVALRRHFEAVRAEVLAEGDLGAEEATRRLVNRLLHDPMVSLRTAAEAGRGDAELAAAIKTLFGIEDAGDAPRSGPESNEGEER